LEEIEQVITVVKKNKIVAKSPSSAKKRKVRGSDFIENYFLILSKIGCNFVQKSHNFMIKLLNMKNCNFFVNLQTFKIRNVTNLYKTLIFTNNYDHQFT